MSTQALQGAGCASPRRMAPPRARTAFGHAQIAALCARFVGFLRACGPWGARRAASALRALRRLPPLPSAIAISGDCTQLPGALKGPLRYVLTRSLRLRLRAAASARTHAPPMQLRTHAPGRRLRATGAGSKAQRPQRRQTNDGLGSRAPVAKQTPAWPANRRTKQ